MQAAFKTKLKVNNRQANYFTKACGVSRFTWNWGLAEWRKQHEEYKAEKREKAPDWMALKKQLRRYQKRTISLDEGSYEICSTTTFTESWESMAEFL